MIDIPRRLRQRPKDPKTGYPIPYMVMVVDGVPDFRAMSADGWLNCVQGRRCQLCGQPHNRDFWFVGGPLCEQNRVFTDPPMHRECAEYALRVCPFLASPRGHFSDLERRPPPGGTGVLNAGSVVRPERFMLGRAADYRVGRVNGEPVIRATPWLELHWWRHGEPIA